MTEDEKSSRKFWKEIALDRLRSSFRETMSVLIAGGVADPDAHFAATAALSDLLMEQLAMIANQEPKAV